MPPSSNTAQAEVSAGLDAQRRGDLDEACSRFRRAIELDHRCASAHGNLAETLLAQGELAPALDAGERALAIAPDDAAMHLAVASIRIALRSAARRIQPPAESRRIAIIHDRGAEKHLRRARSLAAEPTDLEREWSRLCEARGDYIEATERLQRALQQAPESLDLLHRLGDVLLRLGRVEDAVDTLRACLAIEPNQRIHSALLLLLHYRELMPPRQRFEEHLAFAGQWSKDTTQPHVDSDNPPRLRIGYLSPDFRRHSVALFIEGIVRDHDRSRFEVYCYSNTARPDAVTKRFANLADTLRDIRALSDQEAADLIRGDGIHILIDLAGHTNGNRLGVMALRPAPVQVTYLGYPNTTGLDAIDYRITDPVADPPGDDGLTTEHLVRLEAGFLCFEPPEEAPPVAEPPMESAGHVTFACFSTLLKVTPHLLELWARMLLETPHSRLVIKSEAFASRDVQSPILEAFARRGVEVERISLRPWTPGFGAHLRSYGEVDIAVDCYPYNGTTTTCEALYMGVPVITLAGDCHVSRVGASLLHRVGLDDLVAHSAEQYVAVATALAGDPLRLRRLRAGLRETTRRALCDTPSFLRALEGAYTTMWDQRRERP